MLRKLVALASIAALGACVTLEETPMAKGTIQHGQKTVLIVYASPGPVMSVSDMADQMAKVIPGMGLLLAASQDKRDLAASQNLARLMPPWQPDKAFYPFIMQSLRSSGYEGQLVTPADAGFSDSDVAGMNRASDVVDWQSRYMVRAPDNVPQPRNYSMESLRDALILEVNLAYGAPEDGKNNWTPALTTVTKLYKADGTVLLWRHDETLTDSGGTKNEAEYQRNPAELVARLQALMPQMAQNVASDLRKNDIQ
ncbi:MAG TPA: hypothetical protein VNI01_08695 [Elusimicrobiota bacterium]|jgi:hypothetical protein|nr:hypothetical protein [Elusimicrobiota bacterium]